MNKIQRVSSFLRVIFQVAMVAWPLMLMLYWILAPRHGSEFHGYNLPIVNFIPNGLEILHPITTTDVFWGVVIGLLPLVVIMTIFYFLTKLFKLYEQGKIFTALNVRYIKNIGITMLIGQVVNFIYEALISFALTFHNPAGHKFSSISFGSFDMYNIITAIMVIVISWIMAEGCKLQEENQYTV